MKIVLRSKKGQGSTEYIVIIALAVLFLTGIFWRPVRSALSTKVTQIIQGITQAQ